MNWPAFWLSLQVNAIASIIILVAGLLIALLLARARFRGKILVETVIMLPLVLPPSVIGYYLLLAFGRGSPLFEWFNIRILFTWQAAIAASVVVGIPLMVQSSRAALANVDPVLENAARTLGASELRIFWRVTLPLARRGILAGMILGSARALGEFGATLMITGNIPGRTQTLPVAIYDAVQAQRYADAHLMVLVMTGLAFAGLLLARQLEPTPQYRRTDDAEEAVYDSATHR
ncbi:MAG: molybdate ABC transporter permease subunit [Roseiflexus sp.]|jgi:molybdate transport system permease protein|nr:molybdate ABC transporter permease subunit [Roseiflexus sp.]MBO9335266.1 molybdate ABC transporter permease subunit [Roseiflexus sp.]MBO9365020.1 molybdate ABC transporter permease subunit [Roseiflexus sp.]MBO9381195.1 molybdate ABC transporter permease subunit [Roseiflexus sp.]MBO9388135.1 molybdate ABC transporter permease subunit [Roseiflexus sp.]